MPTLKFLFDYGSPTTYLAWKRLPGLIARTGATLEPVPILLGAVFKATGNASPVMVPAKGHWMFTDLALWAGQDGTPLAMNPHFPVNTTRLMRGAIAAADRGEFDAYSNAMFDAMWRDSRAMGDEAIIAAVVTAAGLDAAAYAAAADDPAIKDRLRANTDAAVTAGVFGAPSFFIDGRLFFGQDRMAFVEAALKGEM